MGSSYVENDDNKILKKNIKRVINIRGNTRVLPPYSENPGSAHDNNNNNNNDKLCPTGEQSCTLPPPA